MDSTPADDVNDSFEAFIEDVQAKVEEAEEDIKEGRYEAMDDVIEEIRKKYGL